MRRAGNIAREGHVECMPFRSLAFTLAAAALVAAGCPALAQQAAPVPSASPGPMSSTVPGIAPAADASAAPVAEPSASPVPDETATPAPEPSSKRSLSGTLMSVKGTVATLKMANGTVQTYTVSTKVAAALEKSLGKKLLFRVVKGALDIVPH